MSPAEGRITFLDTLRGVAIVMVVGQHALGYNQLQPETRGMIEHWFQVAVPMFFLVDGWLLFYRLDRIEKFDYADYMRRSAKRLAVPWVIFSLLYLMIRGGYEYYAHPFEQIVLNGDVADLLVALWVGAPAGQMYFLLSLFWLRSLSFATKYMRGFSPFVMLVVVGLANLLWSSLKDVELAGFHIKANWGGGQDPLLHAIWGLQYYLLGCVFYVSNSWLSRNATIFAGSAVATFAYITYQGSTPPLLGHFLYLCSFYFLCLAFGEGRQVLSIIGQYTMGIYLLHFPVVLKLTSIGLSFFLDNTHLLYYLFVVLGTVLLTMLITRVLMSQSQAHYLFGETR